jgi:hypothetical protein
VTKAAFEMFKNRKNGKSSGFLSELERDQMQRDLWRWHKPYTDPVTSQPNFPWYANSREIIRSVDNMAKIVEDLRNDIDKLSKDYITVKNDGKKCP